MEIGVSIVRSVLEKEVRLKSVPGGIEGTRGKTRRGTGSVRSPLHKIHIASYKRRNRVVHGEKGLEQQTVSLVSARASTRDQVEVEDLETGVSRAPGKEATTLS